MCHPCEVTVQDADNIAAQRASFEAACEVLDLVLEEKRSNAWRCDEISAEMAAAMDKHYK